MASCPCRCDTSDTHTPGGELIDKYFNSKPKRTCSVPTTLNPGVIRRTVYHRRSRNISSQDDDDNDDNYDDDDEDNGNGDDDYDSNSCCYHCSDRDDDDDCSNDRTNHLS